MRTSSSATLAGDSGSMSSSMSTAMVSGTPRSSSSNNTFLMPVSPAKGRKAADDGYRPKISKTTGQRPACLVNASVTYCGDNHMYVFGGFDQYTDEVYNHVLKLDLSTLQWTLVDNYGDIPGVRMGHTATLYQGDKLLIFGGENEHRAYLSDVIIFDIKTAHWTQPLVHGYAPKGRARHAAALYEDKLFIVGGVTGPASSALSDVCFLDLKTWTWSKSWKFVGRFDHTAWVWDHKLWVFGGLANDMERGGEMWWLDLKGNPAFEGSDFIEMGEASGIDIRAASRANAGQGSSFANGATGYAANSSSVQSQHSHGRSFTALAPPGAISSLKMDSNPNQPSQTSGTHFHVYHSGSLLDLVTPASTSRFSDCGISALELESLRWQKLVGGNELFDPMFRWHYCAMDVKNTRAWLLGCAVATGEGEGANSEEYLSHVLPIDLTHYGMMSEDSPALMQTNTGRNTPLDRATDSPVAGLGLDLASLFDRSPDQGSGADFIVTAEAEESSANQAGPEMQNMASSSTYQAPPTPKTSVPIHVHKLILQARWPHFGRLYSSQMAEFHTKKMHIPEPYTVVRAFLWYLYTDSIAYHPTNCPSLSEVAGMLVMANVYDLARLRLLCVNRLGRELDVEHAPIVWERANAAGEGWLGRHAGHFCHVFWGRVVRTETFKRLSRESLLDLCAQIDIEGRVMSGDEAEAAVAAAAQLASKSDFGSRKRRSPARGDVDQRYGIGTSTPDQHANVDDEESDEETMELM